MFIKSQKRGAINAEVHTSGKGSRAVYKYPSRVFYELVRNLLRSELEIPSILCQAKRGVKWSILLRVMKTIYIELLRRTYLERLKIEYI